MVSNRASLGCERGGSTGRLRPVRSLPWLVSSTLVVWAAAIAIVQVGFGEDIGRAVEQLEKRFEPQPAERSAPGASPQPRDRSEDDIDPWQLVSV